MADDASTPPQEVGSAYLFNADAQAILEEAPTLDAGLELLHRSYTDKTWDKPEEASKVASTYAQELRYRFKDQSRYAPDEIGKIAPISFGEITSDVADPVDNQIDRVSQWEAKNKEFLNSTTDPDYALVKDKLSSSIEETASNLRRQARVDSRSTLGNAIKDTATRILDGATSPIARLVGADAYVKGLKERTDPSFDDDIVSDITSGIGAVGSIVATGAAGTAAKVAYLVATGAGQVRGSYERSKDATGDSTLALEAAGIETASQAVQLGVAGKTFGTIGGKIGAKIAGKEVLGEADTIASRIAKPAFEQGAANSLGTVLSNEATRVGEDTDKVGLFDRSGRAGLVGAIFGAGAGGVDVALDPSVRVDPGMRTGGVTPPVDKTVIGGVLDPIKTEALKGSVAQEESQGSFVTKDGNIYTMTPEGSTARTKASTQEEFSPFDKTFYVSKETAEALAAVRGKENPDGSPSQILTDGDKLFVKSSYVGKNLEFLDKESGYRLQEVETLPGPVPGAHPVEVNRPKNLNGNEREYRSHIGREITKVNEVPDTSAGAMSIEATKERRLASRLRLSPALDENVRAGFGDSELGISRYFVQPNIVTKNRAGQIISEKGIEDATRDILSLPEDHADPVTIDQGRQLLLHYNDAAIAARKAGDTESYDRLSYLASQIGYTMAQIGTNAGQTVQSFSMWKELDPALRTNGIRVALNETAVKEVASEEGLTPQEVRSVDHHVAAVSEEIAKVQGEAKTNADAIEQSFDPEIQEATKLASEIEKEGEKRLQEHVQTETQKVTEAENEATKLEETAKSETEQNTSEVKAQHEEALGRIKELEDQASKRAEELNAAHEKSAELQKKLEDRGLTKAHEKADKEITLAEKSIEKVKKSGKDTTKIQKGLEAVKAKKTSLTPEDGLNAEEKAELRRLKREAISRPEKATPESVLTAAEKKEIESLKSLSEKVKTKLASKSEIPPKVKLKVDKLRAFAREKKAEIAAKTKEDFLGAKEKSTIEALKNRRDKARSAKAEAQKNRKEFLTEAQKKKIAELTGKKEKLSKVKEKVDTKKREKQKSFSPENEEKMQKLVKVLTRLSEGTSNHRQVAEEVQKLESDALKSADTPGKGNLLYAYWLSNVLSNPATHFANVKGNSFQLLSAPAAYAITGKPGVAAEFIKGVIGSLSEGWEASKGAFLTGENKLRPEGKSGTKNDFVKEGPAGIRYLGYVLRALSAEDEFFYHAARDGQARAVAYFEGKKAGLTGRALTEKIAEYLYNAKSNWEDSMREAEAQAQAIKGAGVNLTAQQIRYTAWELMEAKRPANIREESGRFALQDTFNNTPKGFIGHVVRSLSALSNAPWDIGGKTIRPLRYVMAFLNINGNLANAYLDFTPVGALRSLQSKERVGGTLRKPEFHTKHELQRRAELGRSMLGAAGAGLVGGIAFAFMHDKDPYFAVYGAGPDDNGLKAQLRAQGWIPYSVKIGDTYVRYTETPLALMLGAIGSLSDNVKYNKQYAKSSLSDGISIAVAGMAGSFTDNTFLKNVSDLLEAAKSGGKTKNLSDILANTAKGFVPLSGTLRAISNAIANPIDAKGDFVAKFLQGIPVAESLYGKPTLNAFGDPIGRTFAERTSALSRVYSTRSTDPEWRWLAENGYKIPDPGGFSTVLSKTANLSATKRRAQNLGPEFEGIMTQEERYKFTQESGPKIRQVVARYRARYGSSGYQERVQAALKKDISQVRSDIKKRMFAH